tara:strand:- start:93 stop:341 length:249 start_codon:yes stop_codon:yes gene_type:complete
MENVYEQFFFLKYSGGWAFSEAYNLPLGLRKWFVERLIQQLEAEKAAMEDSSSSKGGSNTQTLSAHNQPQLPPHLNSMKRQG